MMPSPADRFGDRRSDGRVDIGLQRRANRVLQVGLVAALLAGLKKRDPSVVVNGVVSIAFASMPTILERRYDVRFRPWQRLWISTTALIHVWGMLGPYDRIWWWDHLAHTLSGVVVAGVADVFLQVNAEEGNCPPDSAGSRSVFVVGVTLGFGLLWEALEYAVHTLGDRVGFEPLLVNYGRLDTVRDLVFDVLGAGIVVLFGRRALSNVVDSIANE